MVESIWCEVRLDDVIHVLDDYTLWKDGPWYHAVDWSLVTRALIDLLQAKASDGVLDNLLDEVHRLQSQFSSVDSQGIAALVDEPITVTRTQLTNGGHRLAAMRRQGVESVPGLFIRHDVGEGIRPGRTYPISITS